MSLLFLTCLYYGECGISDVVYPNTMPLSGVRFVINGKIHTGNCCIIFPLLHCHDQRLLNTVFYFYVLYIFCTYSSLKYKWYQWPDAMTHTMRGWTKYKRIGPITSRFPFLTITADHTCSFAFHVGTMREHMMSLFLAQLSCSTAVLI